MKRMLIVGLVLALSLAFAGCPTDGGTEPKDILDGTTWKMSGTIDGDEYYYIFTFKSPTFTLSQKTVGEDGGVSTDTGTYSISGNTVTITTDEYTLTGTLSGNTLSFYDGGLLLTKQ